MWNIIPSSIQQDSNSKRSDYETPPLTTQWIRLQLLLPRVRISSTSSTL